MGASALGTVVAFRQWTHILQSLGPSQGSTHTAVPRAHSCHPPALSFLGSVSYLRPVVPQLHWPCRPALGMVSFLLTSAWAEAPAMPWLEEEAGMSLSWAGGG